MAEKIRIEKLLKDLGLCLEQDAKAGQKQLLTFDNPHSCKHCRDDSVQVAEGHDEIRCYKCGWLGIGTVTSPEYRSCDACGELFENKVHRQFSATLKGRLRDAVAAAGSGCLLYTSILPSLHSLYYFARDLEKHCSGDEVKSLLGMATPMPVGILLADASIHAEQATSGVASV